MWNPPHQNRSGAEEAVSQCGKAAGSELVRSVWWRLCAIRKWCDFPWSRALEVMWQHAPGTWLGFLFLLENPKFGEKIGRCWLSKGC